jgi:hypothetical protein
MEYSEHQTDDIDNVMKSNIENVKNSDQAVIFIVTHNDGSPEWQTFMIQKGFTIEQLAGRLKLMAETLEEGKGVVKH